MHMNKPTKEHWKLVERLCGYIKAIPYEGIVYRKPTELRPWSQTNSNYATNPDTRKSVTGNVHTLGGTLTGWTSQHQSIVSLSVTESEYIALAKGGQEIQFGLNLLDKLLGTEETVRPWELYGDNMGSLFLTRNAQVGPQTKHVDTRHHFLRQMVSKGDLDTQYVRTAINTSDVMTKNLGEKDHTTHTKTLLNGELGSWREDVRRLLSQSIPAAMLNKQRGPSGSKVTQNVQSSVSQSSICKTENSGSLTGKPD